MGTRSSHAAPNAPVAARAARGSWRPRAPGCGEADAGPVPAGSPGTRVATGANSRAKRDRARGTGTEGAGEPPRQRSRPIAGSSETGRRQLMASFDYDVVIIGSGFGGSVAALRAAEKGYRVGVMESGRRWKDEDIPKTQWDLPHFLWFPAAELYGIQRIEYLDDVLDPLRRGRGRRLARLRQHAVRPAEAVLRRAGVGGHHRLGRRAGAASRPGDPDARRRSLPVHAHRRRSRPAAGRDRDGTRGDVQQGPGGRLLRQPRASRPTIRTSAASDRAAPAASRAATATSAAATTPRTS